jgi:Zn-dependent peptidase ImmA (M78 family)
MIELLLAVKIIFVSNSAIEHYCTQFVDGCYAFLEDTIYVRNGIKNRSYKDYILYHEIGHLFYKLDGFDKELFKGTIISPDYEVVADNFALYIYSIKYPKYKAFYEKVVNINQRKFLEESCNWECVSEVLIK